VALPVHEGHSEDPRQDRLYRGGRRDRTGRFDSAGDGVNHSGHSEDPLEDRLYRGRKRDRTGGFYDVAGPQYNGHSEDPTADRLYRNGGKAPRSRKPDIFERFYPREKF
jgi:hypothetical protein